MSYRILSSKQILAPPYIQVKAKIVQNGLTNGKENISQDDEYVVAPSAKKIATYIQNQIFGSDLVTQTEGLNIGWLMPTLKEALNLATYQTESFIYIHKYEDKIYLECFKKSDIHDLVQVFDKIKEATIVQEYDSPFDDKISYLLKRKIKIEKGKSYIQFKAFKCENNKDEEITIERFNSLFGTNYPDKDLLNYEVLINIDLGEDFFKDSKNLLIEEMEIMNIFMDEIRKTKTKIATTQHYQAGDIVTNWVPTTHYNIQTVSVKDLQDYFTLLPGDKTHAFFEFLQGEIRSDKYIESFKFVDYQIIQMAGFSPVTFGYEKDAYQNKDNIDLNKNSSEMTIEAIKTQIEPQINLLIENIIKAQKTIVGSIKNELPDNLEWNYGNNEKFDDVKKLKVLKNVQSVSSVPRKIRANIVLPILNKMVDQDVDKKELNDFINDLKSEESDFNIKFGEL